MKTLKELRLAKGLTQKQLADRFFVDMRTIGRWERHEVKVPRPRRNQVANYFNVDVKDIKFDR